MFDCFLLIVDVWIRFVLKFQIWIWHRSTSIYSKTRLKNLERLKIFSFHFISQKMYSTVHYIYIFTRLVTGSQRPIECNKVTLTCVRHINNKARGNKVRGCSQTTLTRFWLFLTSYPPRKCQRMRWHFLWYECWQKVDIFGPPTYLVL